MKLTVAKKQKEVMEDYHYLFDKVIKEKRGDLTPIVESFREELLKDRAVDSYQDLVALDLLYFHSTNNNNTPWKGRFAAMEAFNIIATRGNAFNGYEGITAFINLGEAFDYLEDIDRARICYERASYYSYRIEAKEKAIKYKEKEIALIWRYDKETREKMFPNMETLILMFGKEEAERLFALTKKEPLIIHDPIETNPLYTKVIDKVNIALKEHFEKFPDDFTLDNYNAKKKVLLEKEGIEWTAPIMKV